MALLALILIVFSCSKKQSSDHKSWVNIYDSKDSFLVFRKQNCDSSKVEITDSFAIRLKIYFYKSSNSDSAKIRFSVSSDNSYTRFIKKTVIKHNDINYLVYRYELDDPYSFDDELFFLWNDSLGLFSFGNNNFRKAYKFQFNSNKDAIVDSIISVAIKDIW